MAVLILSTNWTIAMYVECFGKNQISYHLGFRGCLCNQHIY